MTRVPRDVGQPTCVLKNRSCVVTRSGLNFEKILSYKFSIDRADGIFIVVIFDADDNAYLA